MALVVGPQPTHTPPTEEASIRAARCNAEQGRERQPSDGDLARHEGTQGGRCEQRTRMTIPGKPDDE